MLDKIPMEDRDNALVLVPPLPLQVEFARRLESLGQLRLLQESASDKTSALFSSLQYRAFRGEL